MADLSFAFKELFVSAGYWLINLLLYLGMAALLWAPFVAFLLRKKGTSNKYQTFLFGSLLVLMALAVVGSLLCIGKIGIIPYPSI